MIDSFVLGPFGFHGSIAHLYTLLNGRRIILYL